MLNQSRSRKLISLFLVSFLTCVLSGTSSAQQVIRIAAVVNDDVITANDLAQRINLTIATSRMPNTPEVRNRLSSNILRTMIDEKLKTQEAERLEIKIPEENITNGLASYAQSIKVPADKLAEVMAQIGVDIEVLEEQALAELAWSQVVMQQGRNRLNVSDNEINAAFDQIEANKGKPEYLYSEIYLPIENSSEENEARQLAERLVEHIQNGSPFAVLARDFSKSPSSVRGGDLGWVQSGNIAQEIEEVLTRLPLNGFSTPIRSTSGIHLLHLRDKRISGEEENDEILSVSQIIFPITAQSGPDEYAAKIGTARALLQQAKSCDQMDEMGKQLGNVQSGRAQSVKLSKMPPILRTSLTPVAKGQATIVEQPTSILALMVCERDKVAALPEVAKKKNIERQLRLEKVGREDRRLLQKLRRSAFVDIRL